MIKTISISALIAATLLARSVFAMNDAPAPAAPNEPFALLTYLTLKPGTEQKFKEELASIIQPSKAEPGNIAWTVQQSEQDPDQIVFYTRWVNQAALDSHLKSSPLARYLERTAPLLQAPAQLIRYHPLDIQ